MSMKHTSRCQSVLGKSLQASPRPRVKGALVVGRVQRGQLRAVADVNASKLLSAEPATSDPSPSSNIVPLGHGQPERVMDGMEQLVPENVAAARAWIAAWKAKQLDAVVAAAPDSMASARAWIAAWRAKNEAAGAAEVEALRHEVEELKGLLSTVKAAAEEAQAELKHTSANRDTLALSLAQQVFEAAAAREQCEAALAALDNEKEHVLVLLAQQRRYEASAAPAGQQTALKELQRAAATPPPKPPCGFTNTNRFWVPIHLEPRFLRVITERQLAMQQAPGFLGLAVHEYVDPNHPTEEFVLEVSSSWATVPDWEAWSRSKQQSRYELPCGVMQYPPRKGEGFPEDYVPFKDLAGEVPNAKY